MMLHSPDEESLPPLMPTPMQSQQARSPQQLNYVSLDLNSSGESNSRSIQKTQYSQVMPSKTLASATPATPTESHYEHINLQSHTPEKKFSFGPNDEFNYHRNGNKESLAFPKLDEFDQQHHQRTDTNYNFPPKLKCDDIRAHRLHQPRSPIDEYNGRSDILQQTDAFKQYQSAAAASTVENPGQYEKLSLEKYDYLMGNTNLDMVDGAAAGAQFIPPNDLGREHNARRNSDEHSNNVDRIRTMQELGVPPDEIMEINRRITQQEKDEVILDQGYKSM